MSVQLLSQIYHLAQHLRVYEGAVCCYRELGLHAVINVSSEDSGTSKIESCRTRVDTEPCFHSKS